MRYVIIGLSGRMGSGKTHLARRLIDRFNELGVAVKKAALADALKEAGQLLFSLSDEQVFTQVGKATIDPRWGLTPRQILQFLGTEGLRLGFGSAAVNAGAWTEQEQHDVWVRILEGRLGGFSGVVIVDDIRFLNEAKWVVENRGLLIRIDREDANDQTGHASEWALDNFSQFFMRQTRRDDEDFPAEAVASIAQAALSRLEDRLFPWEYQKKVNHHVKD